MAFSGAALPSAPNAPPNGTKRADLDVWCGPECLFGRLPLWRLQFGNPAARALFFASGLSSLNFSRPRLYHSKERQLQCCP